MKIKKKLQKLFKTIFQKLFFLIHGKITYTESYNDIDAIKIKEIKELNIWDLKYKCFSIKKGRIYNDSVENVCVISKNNLVPGANYQRINGELVNDQKNICLKKGTPRIKIKKNGKLLSLIQDASGENYAHWFLDILPRLKICETLYSIENIDYFLLPEIKNNFQFDSLKILNIPLNKVVNCKKFRHVEADELIITSHPWYSKGKINDEMHKIPKWIILWLRESFLPKAEFTFSHDKIFIDRSDSLFNHCKIINFDEVWNFLKLNGFKKYKLSEINLENQIGLFNSAKIIVGAHGAGLSNLIFSKPKSKVIELKPINHINKLFSRISEINNLEHHTVNSKKFDFNTNIDTGDIYVDVKNLNMLIN